MLVLLCISAVLFDTLKELEAALENVNSDQKKLQKLHKKLQEEFEEKKQISENKEEVRLISTSSI